MLLLFLLDNKHSQNKADEEKTFAIYWEALSVAAYFLLLFLTTHCIDSSLRWLISRNMYRFCFRQVTLSYYIISLVIMHTVLLLVYI